VAITFAAGRGASAGTKVAELHIAGDRERIRWWASQHALELLRRGAMERM
jgi:nicotinamide-nucleotide amidase